MQFIRSTNNAEFHWVFLPGGPSLGSESLQELTNLLVLPGTIWHLDLPGDGSNRDGNNAENFSHWNEGLQEAIKALTNVILVAHSSGGMFALATPELEKYLHGLVLMDSAPNASWQESFAKYVQENPVKEFEELQNEYNQNLAMDY